MVSLSRLRPAALLLLLALLPLPAILSPPAHAAAPDRASGDAGEAQAMAAATRDLCGKDIVLLGENGFHGDGKTIAFKAALVRRLVRRCGFNALYFESSHYDFLEISRRHREGRPVSPDMISSAIGGLWNRDEEMAPLVSFLHAEVRSGRVTLGGLDDQLGGRGMFYSLDAMPTELASYLDGARRTECRELLRQRIWSDYPSGAPYSEGARARIRQCVDAMRTAIAAAEARDRGKRDELLQMLANIERAIGRDFVAGNRRAWDRDFSMYLNLRWLAARTRGRPRIIVWASNSHVARDAGATPLYSGGLNLGSRVRQAYGGRAFALGFTAASGSFRYTVRTARPIPVAPPQSLEARALAGGRDVAYLGPVRLARMGLISGAAFDDHQQVLARWAGIYDGVVVFRAERPPRRTDE